MSAGSVSKMAQVWQLCCSRPCPCYALIVWLEHVPSEASRDDLDFQSMLQSYSGTLTDAG